MIEIIIPQKHWPGKLLNINAMRGHPQAMGRIVRPWRDLGAIMAMKDRLKPMSGPVDITGKLRFSNEVRRDSANFYPTFKALIDGLVSKKVLEDDSDRFVSSFKIERIRPNGRPLLVIEMAVRE